MSLLYVCLSVVVFCPPPHLSLCLSAPLSLSVYLYVCECMSVSVWGYGGEGVSACLRACVRVCMRAQVCGEGEGGD